MALTHDIYGQRKLELVRGIELAEGEFHSAALKEQTGAGTSADTKAAKEHLAKLRDDLEALEGAWIASKAQSQQDASARRQESFDAFLEGCEELFEARADAVKQADEAARKLGQAIVDYEIACREIRARLVPFHGYISNDTARSSAFSSVSMSLEPSTWVASMAAGAALGDLRISVPTHMQSTEVFGKKSPAEFETAMAARVKNALKLFAPES
ncbi:hypothetical protein [Novosphingobium olei]|uniref:hypothetical protein n=1 Tax=Novosphingobium olei TaxID=2728851 RepID=UPI00308683E3|nr:hypothetical protein NSDW_10640 [Novosphingobium olei]